MSRTGDVLPPARNRLACRRAAGAVSLLVDTDVAVANRPCARRQRRRIAEAADVAVDLRRHVAARVVLAGGVQSFLEGGRNASDLDPVGALFARLRGLGRRLTLLLAVGDLPDGLGIVAVAGGAQPSGEDAAELSKPVSKAPLGVAAIEFGPLPPLTVSLDAGPDGAVVTWRPRPDPDSLADDSRRTMFIEQNGRLARLPLLPVTARHSRSSVP